MPVRLAASNALRKVVNCPEAWAVAMMSPLATIGCAGAAGAVGALGDAGTTAGAGFAPRQAAAAKRSLSTARKVATVSAFGYASFLVGPPLLGFVGQAIGVVNMYWIVLMFIVLSVVVAGAAGNTKASAKAVKGE